MIRFRPRSCALLILGVVVLAEAILFVGYHHDRWYKSLIPLGRPRALTGEGLVVRNDGHGYYAWLRSLLIDGDWSFDNEFDDHNVVGDWVPPPGSRTALGRRANPWPVGPACAWAVTVVPGHLWHQALPGSDWPADGYSMPYQLLVGLTTLLLSFLGLGFLYGICRQHADPVRAALAAALLTLGTPIVYYSAIEGSMAHGLGTVALAALVWYWQKTYGSPSPRRWLTVGVLVGVTALMRWQLATFAVLPLGEALLSRGPLLRRLGGLGLAALGAAVAFAPQLLAWRVVYGQWLATPIVVSHNWLHPAWWQILAGYDRGLFIWTPLSLLALAGFSCRRPAGPLALLPVAFALQVYVLASLWGSGVYLGVAFGFRHLTESLVVLAPGLALLLRHASGRGLRLLVGAGCLLVLWNLLLVCQYRYGLIPAADGADAATLAENVVRLLRRKQLLLVGQVFLAPVLLALLFRVGVANRNSCVWRTPDGLVRPTPRGRVPATGSLRDGANARATAPEPSGPR